MSSPPDQEPRHLHCRICSQLRDYENGLQTVGRPEEDTFVPRAAYELVTVKELNPPGDTYVKQCPECATYYLYDVIYEYVVFGSEDEQTLKRLTDEKAAKYLAQPVRE